MISIPILYCPVNFIHPNCKRKCVFNLNINNYGCISSKGTALIFYKSSYNIVVHKPSVIHVIIL